ncbi:hypothetical protein OIU84_009971 [Salix udensis]|uniref:Uncharacterized protein n=1 Tax=Salix udensis TaxID=889485 RepID=A0AAD6JJZ9_9ROSI|nr:hypothetical protein OIU84_009971 [Salix udensis]
MNQLNSDQLFICVMKEWIGTMLPKDSQPKPWFKVFHQWLQSSRGNMDPSAAAAFFMKAWIAVIASEDFALCALKMSNMHVLRFL